MEVTKVYQSILDLTHRMLGAAMVQDWESLVSLEKQRSILAAKLANARPPTRDADKRAIGEIIADVERESAKIIERVEQWREDVKILLRVPSR